ncbi:MAG TPA: multicopper oxidase family protein [Bryobacteraceae bacterium]|nr:multicopper oxidase family protein [Bryobacteraceae bacterium]
MTRREFASLTGGLLSLGPRLLAQQPADITLKISEIDLELAPGHTVRTLAYNGQVPGPLLRMTLGKKISVDVINDTREPEMVHWHGFQIPPEVDGAHEEGTPMVQGKDKRRYTFTPQPAGTRWYHAHAMAGTHLNRGTYSGQFGMAIIEPRDNPGRYDQEVPILLHEWDAYFSTDMMNDVEYRTFSINGKMLGAGEPIRVKRGQRILFRILNSSATGNHRLALAGHTFSVVALDGNAIAKPVEVPVLEMGPGERIDAIVEMKNPGIWILGEEDDRQRFGGAGIVVEYADATGGPKWIRPQPFVWDYLAFGGSNQSPEPAHTVPLVFEPRYDGNLWAINGKSWPKTDPFFVKPGVRNRLVFDNRCDMSHPVHLHRHTFELTKFAGRQTSGVFKDVVLVPKRSIVEVDLMAAAPGPSLFHCHQQFHMDYGFMAVMQYLES